MTHRERMLAVLKQEDTDRVPWVPRLDLWYNAHRRAGTLPDRYRDATLMQICEDLDFGYHAVVPNLKDLRDPADELHRALGVYNLWTMPYRTVFEGVRTTAVYEGDETAVIYDTPGGRLTTRVLYDEGMRRAGITITHISEYAIKQPADYRTVAYLFDHARVEPNYGGYSEFSDYVGEQGLAVAFVNIAGSPVHLLQRELMPFEMFFTELYDHPEELFECAVAIGRYFERVFRVVADSPAEVVLFGANYDATVTYPPLFRDHILPWLRRFADILHDRGKFLLTHTDGENRGLLDLYVDSGIDIADSICPRPMTSLSFREVQERFGKAITIMGGIPSVCLLPETIPDRDFEDFVDDFLAELYTTDRLILGISDTTPPAASLSRLIAIGEKARGLRSG
jgi:hypothetical protein